MQAPNEPDLNKVGEKKKRSGLIRKVRKTGQWSAERVNSARCEAYSKFLFSHKLSIN